MQTVPEYGWKTPAAVGSSRLLLPGILRVAGRCGGVIAPGTRVLDLGCGNGYIAGSLLGRGCEVTGVDASASGIEIARQNYRGRRGSTARSTTACATRSRAGSTW